MKITKFFIVVIIAFLSIIKLEAACPNGTGWIQQPTLSLTYTYPDNSDCQIMISWCKRSAGYNPYGALCEVHISDIYVNMECYNSNYSIDIEQILEKLIASGELAGCFTSIPDCPDQGTSTVLYSTGGCYWSEEIWWEEVPYMALHPCNPTAQYFCKEIYSVCKELVGGQWVYHVTGENPYPTFQCQGECFSICD